MKKFKKIFPILILVILIIATLVLSSCDFSSTNTNDGTNQEQTNPREDDNSGDNNNPNSGKEDDQNINNPFHVHKYSEDWTHNETHHWHAATCEHSDEKDSYSEHEFINGICVCGYTENKTEVSDFAIIADNFMINDDKLSLTVDNEIVVYNFINEIKVKDTSKWELYSDFTCQNKIISKTASLNYGNNVYYILVTDKNEEIKLYTVEIYRNKIIDITFNSNGGSSIQSIQREQNKDYGVLETPIRTGYTFNGWFIGEERIESITKVGLEDNYELKAAWTVNSYTITYNTNGGNINSTTQEVTYDSEYTLLTPTREGYTFAGWYNGDTLYISGTWNKLNNVTLTAKWFDSKFNPEFDENYNLISFTYGEYPQTIKADDVTITDTIDSREYYLGSDGAYYAKVAADPHENGYKFSNGTTITKNTEYYFKVEPIKWKVLYNSDGTYMVISDLILDTHCYHSSTARREGATDYQENSTTETVYANNYKYSDIRTFLNTTFLNTAFTSDEQNKIQITTVDNSVYSTGYRSNSYACEDTQDKIFLLSYREATNVDYGFSSSSSSSSTRYAKGTDYAKARGLYVNTSSGYDYTGNSYWWLRSPINDSYYNGDRYARCVGIGGDIDIINVYYDYSGVRPALNINL